ncbi:hypothetical protein MARCHEWKA_01380 [Brevundimonas phage vB_BpoS-Marchewka]|uniref:Uncharacterized protein n=1 Tax=Brevundimonas phage vB_BpoS-Marchewka TaxID=2948604 RepID=A0A9E7N5N7_9CAUD|nr:hypothetical protein MARCHEWKA_01380 [Brevundimonas phage vB_BpoS-Marchewka]
MSAPIFMTQNDGHLDFRCDIWNSPTDESGDSDIAVLFSFADAPGDGSYLQLIDGDESDSLPLNEAQVAALKPRLIAAAEAYAQRADVVRMEAALETAIVHIQALTDARQAGASMVEASTLLEDWAVAAADLLPDAPPEPDVIRFPSLRLERDDVAVILDFEGEGASGDYDPTDSGDEPLMRVAVERRINDVWEFVEDSSYCTQISARASEAGKILALSYILNGLSSEGSVKRHMERMSWIELTVADGDSPDFSRVPA